MNKMLPFLIKIWHVGFMLQKLGIVNMKIRHCLQKNISIEK
jgi:hypothetical protein